MEYIIYAYLLIGFLWAITANSYAKRQSAWNVAGIVIVAVSWPYWLILGVRGLLR